jgi:RHS repeat-associated protein
MHFTGKERDSETGLDYFGKRYYSSGLGRWTSVDPILIKIDRLIDPQRLNLYAMVGNNPVTNKDPDGADLVAGSGDQKAIKSALKEIASRPGGREFLKKMDNLTQTIKLSTGTGMVDHGGNPAPGRTRPAEGADPRFSRTRDANDNITDVKAPNLDVTIETRRRRRQESRRGRGPRRRRGRVRRRKCREKRGCLRAFHRQGCEPKRRKFPAPA